MVQVLCEKMEELLLSTAGNGHGHSIADLFLTLGDVNLFARDINKTGFPNTFDTEFVVQSKIKPLCLRWISNPLFRNHVLIGWQLTGVLLDIPSKSSSSDNQDESISAAIINTMPGIFYLFDENGKYLRWNKRLESVSGYSAEEISNMNPQEFFAENEKAYIAGRIIKVLEEGIGDAEASLLTKDGQKIPHYFTGKRIHYQGRTCLIGMGIDISELKNAGAEIRLSNERYRLAIKATNNTIWEWDLEPESPFWGEELCARFGHKPVAPGATKTFWESNLHPQDKERVVSGIESFIDSKDTGLWSEEYRFRRADGKYAIIADRGFLVFDEEGNVRRIVGSVQDITDKKALEKKLLRQELNKQKLVAQAVINAQEKERADIGKELQDNINQVLSTCKLYLELSQATEEKRNELTTLSIQNIDVAIRQIRNISKALVPRSLGDVGLVDSIHDLVETIRFSYPIHVEFHVLGNFEEHIGDHQKLMLFRIIQEQINYVVKQAHAKNLFIELLVEENENIIELNISDDGVGLDPGMLQPNSGTSFSNIVSRADLFNGTVNIVSAPQKGCKLSVNIPIHNLEKELS